MSAWGRLLAEQRIVAVIRSGRSTVARQMALAVAQGGIRLMEITWNTDQAQVLIPELQRELPDCCIGTGTILDRDMALRAIDCGASFLFMPHTDPDLIALGRSAGVPVIAGAMTPTEILRAWQAGATAVKVFPITNLGGASYLRSLTPVFPHIPLIPTGGVTLDNVQDLLRAGAVAVGIASNLFLGTDDNYGLLVQRSQVLLGKVQSAPISAGIIS